MRHEEIERFYKHHYFTSHRDVGGIKKLVGDVAVLVYFVNDSESAWTEFAKRKFKETNRAALQLIVRTARSRGVDLKMRISYREASATGICTPHNYYLWSKDIVAKGGIPNIPAYQQKYEAVNRCTEVPILFVLNKDFRSGAVAVDWEARMQGEMSIISSKAGKHTIVHELLHQFGAMDLYYPKEVDDLIRNMRYESVMSTADSLYIDSLTSYLIGWTDEIDVAAEQILERTKHLTKEYMYNAIRIEHEKG